MRLAWLIIPLLVFVPGERAGATGDPGTSGVVQAEEERTTEQRRQMREDFAGIRVDERLGETIAFHIPFRDHHGRDVTVADYVLGDRPVVLTFVYHDCPMLCSLVLDGLSKVVAESNLRLGRDYSVLAVSIDPRDTPEQALAAHTRYSRQLGANDDPDALIFLTGSEASIAQLTDAVGFRYEWLEDQQEFAHNATLVFLSPAGLVTRYLYGLNFPTIDFRRAVVEAGEGTVGSVVDQILLYCFAYNPDKGGYVLQAMNAMKLGGMLTLVLLLGSLLVFWRREVIANLARARSGRWRDYEDALRTAPGS